jgi:EAL domain-containing protein (putative c-di-GMP-specific phosphodiesterase class I)
MLARVRGADFALLLPHATNAELLAETLSQALSARIASAHPELDHIFHIGVVHYRRGQAMDVLLANADNALTIAEAAGDKVWHAAELDTDAPLAISAESWRSLLSGALAERRLKLVSFPVKKVRGSILHQESVARLQIKPDGDWLSAGDFMPMAERLKLTAELDLQVVRLALLGLQTGQDSVALNVSADSITDWGFRNKLTDLLGAQPDLCKRLWIEVSEQGVFRQLEAFRELCHALKNLGCRVGVEHVGHRFGEITKITDIGLDYLKVDGSFVHEIHANPGNQEFLKGLCNMAHSIGVMVIAEGVHSAEEMDCLPGLGFDGVTGRAVT